MCESPDCLQLTEREAQVCMAVCESDEPVSFSALRSKLGYHQEVISRILRRLVNHRAIEKFRGKYRRVSQ
jgi:DNA-binding MarR family transcriptional regulator